MASIVSVNSSPGAAAHGLDRRNKIVVGVVVPIAILASLLLLLVIWKWAQGRSRPSPTSPEETQPYLQQKAELEAEEKAKHELDTNEVRPELDPTNDIHEIGLDACGRTTSTHRELRVPEHSKELEVPNNF